MDTEFRLAALTEALGRYGTPELFNTDQGRQFTSIALATALQGAGIRCSMAGRGRCLDNAFIERLWRSLKYEAAYLRELADGFTAHAAEAYGDIVGRNSKRRWQSRHEHELARAGYEGIRGRCGAREVELFHSFHRLVHPLPRTPTPFAAPCFSRRRGRLTANRLHLSLPLTCPKDWDHLRMTQERTQGGWFASPSGGRCHERWRSWRSSPTGSRSGIDGVAHWVQGLQDPRRDSPEPLG